jgi:hypothetical protein
VVAALINVGFVLIVVLRKNRKEKIKGEK